MAACSSSACCARHPRACVGQVPPAEPAGDAVQRSAAAARLRAAAGASGELAVSHTTGANLPFAKNWWRHLQKVGVRNFALLATDDAAYTALLRELPD